MKCDRLTEGWLWKSANFVKISSFKFAQLKASKVKVTTSAPFCTANSEELQVVISTNFKLCECVVTTYNTTVICSDSQITTHGEVMRRQIVSNFLIHPQKPRGDKTSTRGNTQYAASGESDQTTVSNSKASTGDLHIVLVASLPQKRVVCKPGLMFAHMRQIVQQQQYNNHLLDSYSASPFVNDVKTELRIRMSPRRTA